MLPVLFCLAGLLGQAQSLRKAVAQKGNASMMGSAAWVAGSWGDCLKLCGPARFRPVECRDLYTGTLVGEGACEGPKPENSRPCACGGMEACKTWAASAMFGCPASSGGGGGAASPAFAEVGCFATELPPPAPAPLPGSEPRAFEPPYTMSCFEWKGSGKCAGGLPFYELAGEGSMPACAKFCLSKGMDIFGVEAGDICRCGASAVNHQVWQKEFLPSGLVFDPKALVQDAGCSLRVSRYAGFYEGRGVPESLWELTRQDVQYVDNVALGYATPVDANPGVLDRLSPMRADAESGQSLRDKRIGGPGASKLTSRPSFKRDCAREQCGWARYLWGGDRKMPPKWWLAFGWRAPRGLREAQAWSEWKEHVTIPYLFVNVLPRYDDAKETFRSAAAIWAASTCVRFEEFDTNKKARDGGLGFKAAVRVDFSGVGCQTNSVPDENRFAMMGASTYIVQLGGCKDERHLGHMVHELGHVIGMGHEMQRPDAQETYHGKGPYIKVLWEAVGERTPQFRMNKEAYTGSKDRGRVEYAFDSVMNYPALDDAGKQWYDIVKGTLPDWLLVDNLKYSPTELTEGDIAQVLDIYKCEKKRP